MKEMLATLVAIALWKFLLCSLVLCAFAVLAIVVISTILVGGVVVLALFPVLIMLRVLSRSVRALEYFAAKAPIHPVMAFR